MVYQLDNRHFVKAGPHNPLTAWPYRSRTGNSRPMVQMARCTKEHGACPSMFHSPGALSCLRFSKRVMQSRNMPMGMPCLDTMSYVTFWNFHLGNARVCSSQVDFLFYDFGYILPSGCSWSHQVFTVTVLVNRPFMLGAEFIFNVLYFHAQISPQLTYLCRFIFTFTIYVHAQAQSWWQQS